MKLLRTLLRVTYSNCTIDLAHTKSDVYSALTMVPQVYTRQNIQQIAEKILGVDVTDRKFYDTRKRYSDLQNALPNVWTLDQAKSFLTIVYLVDRFRNHKTVAPLYEATKTELDEVLNDAAVSIEDYLSHVKKLY